MEPQSLLGGKSKEAKISKRGSRLNCSEMSLKSPDFGSNLNYLLYPGAMPVGSSWVPCPVLKA